MRPITRDRLQISGKRIISVLFSLVLSLFVCFPLNLAAGGNIGVSPFDFLFLDTSARPAAMGGAYAALSAGPETLDYNPAGLDKTDSNSVAFSHRIHFQDVSQQTAGIIFKPDSIRNSFAFTLNTLGFGNIQRTTLSNPSGAGLGNFSIRDWAISAGLSQNIKDNLSSGLSVKYLRETIDDITGDAIAIDIGFMTDLNNYDLPITLGVAAQNIGTKVKFQSDREDLPLNLKMGMAYKFLTDKGVFAIDMNSPRKGETSFHAGFEFKSLKYAAVRIGYNGRNESGNGLTIGFAGTYNKFLLEYAFIPYGNMGNSNVISLAFMW